MADQDDDYFNDLSQQPMLPRSGNTGGNNSGNEDDGNPIPRQKRMACVVCRKRKLRCDGKKPSCGTCARVGHNCAYDEVRKKSGPKRGYVKQLEARLAQVETLLRNQEPENSSNATNHNTIPNATVPSTTSDAIPDLFNFSNQSIPQRSEISGQSASSQKANSTANSTVDTEKSWEVISLGLEEALPSQEVMDELFDVYFKKIHPSSPMIHRARFFAAMDLAPHMRPPVCLRYIMWALAAALTPKYSFLEEHLYARARKYIHMDEMKGHGEHMVSMHHCQAWILIALYEFKQMYFPRAWISVGRAARMAVMMCFNRLDGVGLDVKHCVPPPRDWVDKEERRRTFWMCFAEDRFASIGTGWPMTFDERDIMTNLPSSEEAFLTGKAETAPSLKDVLAGDIANLSPLGIVSVMACVFGLNLTHLHRPDSQDREGDINGEFWKRHRAYDNILLNVALSLPQSLRLPQGISNPNIIFANMSIHTSAICLHQAAIFKAEKYKKLSQIAAESKRRCIIAADQVTSIMRMVSHTDLSLLNPFSAFCLYVAARVFVQYLKSRPDDEAVQSSLQFLLTALGALKQFSALTESFMIQLDVDLSGTSFGSTMASMRSKQAAQSMNDAGCTPLVHIGSSQTDLHTNESLHKDAPASHRSSSASGGGSVSLQNMPNRPRQNNPPRTNQQQPLGRERLHGSSGNSTDVTRNNSPGQDDQNRLMNYDMDISSDNMNSASDNPSPETLNSSSNTAFTPPNMDQLSVNGQSYNASKNMANSNFMDFGADINGLSNQNDMSFSPLFDMSASNVPIDTLGVENPMALNTIWSDHIAQPAGLENSSFSMEGTNNLSDPQFDMLLRGMGWNGWDDQAIGQ